MHRSSIFLILFLSSLHQIGFAETKHVVVDVFDWDDNIANMPTEVVLFEKKTGKEYTISSGQYAVIRNEIGKAGSEYEKFEERSNLATGTLRNFADEHKDGKNHFLEDLKLAMKTENWKGPSLEPFVRAMEDEQSAKHTFIITARLHNPESIHQAVTFLKNQGVIKYALPAENIWPVLNPTFGARFEKTFGKTLSKEILGNSSARKAAVMEQLLGPVAKTEVPQSINVVGPEGKSKGRFHLFAYSDDDFKNFSRAVSDLQIGIDAGRWDNIKVTVYFTGLHHPYEKPRAIVLRKGQQPRELADEERTEWARVLDCRRSKAGASNFSDAGIEAAVFAE